MLITLNNHEHYNEINGCFFELDVGMILKRQKGFCIVMYSKYSKCNKFSKSAQLRIETQFPLMFDLTINMELIRVSFCCDVSFSGWGMHNVNEISPQR